MNDDMTVYEMGKGDRIPTARQLIERCSRSAMRLFEKDGEITCPIWHIVRSDGEELAFVHPLRAVKDDRDLAADLARDMLKKMEAVVCVFISESWMATLPGGGSKEETEKIFREGISQHPDRVEAVTYTGEDASGQLQAYQLIDRPEKQKPRLLSLKWLKQEGRTEGRLVGMLPRQAGQAQH